MVVLRILILFLFFFFCCFVLFFRRGGGSGHGAETSGIDSISARVLSGRAGRSNLRFRIGDGSGRGA